MKIIHEFLFWYNFIAGIALPGISLIAFIFGRAFLVVLHEMSELKGGAEKLIKRLEGEDNEPLA